VIQATLRRQPAEGQPVQAHGSVAAFSLLV
jgi:hypothetical protein